MTFTARVFPIGRNAPVQPYVGGGVAILAWRYSESGEFVDFNAGNEVFQRHLRGRAATRSRPVVFGGVRVPVGDNFLIGGEFRWHGGEATLDEARTSRAASSI